MCISYGCHAWQGLALLGFCLTSAGGTKCLDALIIEEVSMRAPLVSQPKRSFYLRSGANFSERDLQIARVFAVKERQHFHGHNGTLARRVSKQSSLFDLNLYHSCLSL